MFIGSCAVRQIAYHDCAGCAPPHRLHTDTTRGCRQSDSLSIRLRTTGFARETPDRKLSVLERRFVGNGQFLATFRTTCSQHLATVGGSHSRAESVLVDSLATRRLISSLHCHNYLVFIVSSFSIGCMSLSGKRHMRSAKVLRFFNFTKENEKFYSFLNKSTSPRSTLRYIALNSAITGETYSSVSATAFSPSPLMR